MAIAGVLLLFGILAVVSTRITFEEDIANLIPQTRENSELQRVLKNMSFADKLVVLIEKEPGVATESLTEYASEFVETVRATTKPYLKDIQGTVDENTLFETLDFVYNNSPIFLTEEDYTVLEEKLHPDSIASRTRNNYQTLVAPSGFIARKTILRDPLGTSLLGLKHLQELGVGENFKIRDGFIMTHNESTILLFLSPSFSTDDGRKNNTLTQQLYSIQKRLNDRYSNKVSARYYGAGFIADANAYQIKRDIQITLSIAGTALLLLFIFFYKKLLIPIIIFIPTVFGGLISVVFLYLLRAEISAISLGIGSVLIGVTLDYSLHIVTHIRNNPSKKKLFSDITQPVLMSSLTTALAFLCLLFIDSQALQDLGIFAAVSVLGASVFALLFIPQAYHGTGKQEVRNHLLDRVAAFPFHKKTLVSLVIILLLIVSMFTYSNVEFNNDLSQLNYEPAHLTETKKRLDEVTDAGSKSVYVATYGTTAEEALQANDRVYNKLQHMRTREEVAKFMSLAVWMPSRKTQLKKIERWNQFWTDSLKLATRQKLSKAGTLQGFRPTAFSDFYAQLDTEFTPIDRAAFIKSKAFRVDDYLSEKEDFSTVTTIIQTNGDTTGELKALFDAMPNTLLIDRELVNETLLGNLKTDFNRLIWYCMGVVLLILFLFYRSFGLLLVTGIPIFLTWLLTIGMMGLLQLEFNIFNSIIATFIFGLGVDYSIFITNGLRATDVRDLVSYKTSILLSMITTLLGVGVLLFAKHPALHSLAFVAVIGIVSAVVISFTVQPVLYRWIVSEKKEEIL